MDVHHSVNECPLCILYKNHEKKCCTRSGVTRCTLFYLSLPGPYVPVRVTRGALDAHHYTYAPSRCRSSQCRRTFILLSLSLWNDLGDPVFDGVGLADCKSKANAFFGLAALSHFVSYTVFPLSSFILLVGIVELESSDWRPSQYHGTFIPSQWACGTILQTLYLMVWDWRVSRAGPMFLYWPKFLSPFLSSTVFPFSSFLL